jgi:hypothetical protein
MLRYGTANHHTEKQAAGEGDADTHGVRYNLFPPPKHHYERKIPAI